MAYFYEKIDVVYEDNRDKLRFTIKVKIHLRFTRNGRLRIYEDNKFPFTVYEDNKSAFTVYENTPLAPSLNVATFDDLQTLSIFSTIPQEWHSTLGHNLNIAKYF